VDDLLFVVLGIVPGAVVGGRIGYLLLYPTFVAGDVGRLLDPGRGGMELTLAVVGGAITGGMTAALLDGRPGRWLHVAALPALVVLGLGKLAMVLGGSGQGQATTVDPATAYVGPGPWGSLGPTIPSIPSQALEGIATLVLLTAMLVVLLLPGFRRRDGRAFFLALAGWSAIRLVVASTWRDPVVFGPVRAEQLIAIGVRGVPWSCSRSWSRAGRRTPRRRAGAAGRRFGVRLRRLSGSAPRPPDRKVAIERSNRSRSPRAAAARSAGAAWPSASRPALRTPWSRRRSSPATIACARPAGRTLRRPVPGWSAPTASRPRSPSSPARAPASLPARSHDDLALVRSRTSGSRGRSGSRSRPASGQRQARSGPRACDLARAGWGSIRV
jgi:prolipoprotein diacylglyceryltransferase